MSQTQQTLDQPLSADYTEDLSFLDSLDQVFDAQSTLPWGYSVLPIDWVIPQIYDGYGYDTQQQVAEAQSVIPSYGMSIPQSCHYPQSYPPISIQPHIPPPQDTPSDFTSSPLSPLDVPSPISPTTPLDDATVQEQQFQLYDGICQPRPRRPFLEDMAAVKLAVLAGEEADESTRIYTTQGLVTLNPYRGSTLENDLSEKLDYGKCS
jgi:hypothetical protein